MTLRRGIAAKAGLVGGVLLTVLGSVAPPATATVELGPDRIVVRGQGGTTATITRKPFRMAFLDAQGRTVLSQVANTGQLPFVQPPIPDPEPGGAENVPSPTLYAPFTFTVGAHRDVQDPGGAHEGNILTGVEGGTQFSARDVVEAVPQGAGVRLTLATSDPTGRRLVVSVTPGPGEVFRVEARPTPDTGVAVVADSFDSGDGEAFHGFGGRHNSVDQRGEDLYTWLEEENYATGPFQPLFDYAPGTGGKTYLFPNGRHAAYYPQPLFVSSRPYAFMIDRDELTRFRMASDRSDAWQAGAAAPALDYVVAPGAAPEAAGALTAISGRHRVPPRWALGPITGKNLTAETITNSELYERQVRERIAEIREYKIPYKAFKIEGWESLPEETVRELCRELRSMGIHPLLYFTPFLNAASSQEEIDRGYSVRTATGQPYIYPSVFGAVSLWDFSNPEAVRAWQDKIRKGLDLGADGFMQDWGEQVQIDMHFANGQTGASMHNRYPVLYHGATRALVDRYERETGRQIFFYTRSGFTGSPGSAASEGANFPGDETADWSRSNGIAMLTTDMLNRGIGGAFGYSTDIGGYLDTFGPITKELFVRWSQWAALSPVFRVHNSVGQGSVQPWTFDDETVALFRGITDLRERAVPLIERLWEQAARTGVPIARPLWLQFPEDPEAAKQDQQWMLGPDVLVAPVVEEGARARDVYFPRGCWEHPETGDQFTGARSARVDAPLGRLPYFFRCGTNPFAQAAGKRACLARRSPIGPRNIGRVRLGYTRRQLLRRVRPRPVRRTRRAWHWCVKDRRGGRVSAVFGRDRRVAVVTTSAPAHGNRRLRPSSPLRRVRRAYPRGQRIGRSLYRAEPKGGRFFVLRRGRVRLVGVTTPKLMDSPGRLLSMIRRSRL